jgi:nitrite reductase/ring-hydroxylating ferredoxin subunit
MGARRPASGQDVTVLCRLNDIPDGGSRGALPNERGRDGVLLVRQAQRVYAYVNNCPHYDRAPLGWKKDAFLSGDGRHIMCAAHGALFEIESGACALGPCLGQGLTPVSVRVEDGVVVLIEPDGT